MRLVGTASLAVLPELSSEVVDERDHREALKVERRGPAHREARAGANSPEIWAILSIKAWPALIGLDFMSAHRWPQTGRPRGRIGAYFGLIGGPLVDRRPSVTVFPVVVMGSVTFPLAEGSWDGLEKFLGGSGYVHVRTMGDTKIYALRTMGPA